MLDEDASRTMLLTSQLDEMRKKRFNLSQKERDEVEMLYAAETRHTDFYVGKIIELLKRHNLFKNCILVVLSDHGEEFLEHGHFVAHDINLYNETLSVPLIIHLLINLMVV